VKAVVTAESVAEAVAAVAVKAAESADKRLRNILGKATGIGRFFLSLYFGNKQRTV